MSEQAHSLLDGPGQQLLPIEVDGPPAAPAESIDACARIPVFTGDRFFERFPERYRLFCALFFSSGIGQMEACRLLRMSPQTGASIIARELSSMSAEQLRQHQVRQARAVVSMSMSAMLEALADPARVAAMSQRDHAQALRVAHEVASLLDGQPTARTERVGDSDANQRAADLLRSLGSSARPVRVTEINPGRVEDGAAAAGAPGQDGTSARDWQSREAGAQGVAPADVATMADASYTHCDMPAGDGARVDPHEDPRT